MRCNWLFLAEGHLNWRRFGAMLWAGFLYCRYRRARYRVVSSAAESGLPEAGRGGVLQ
jgi:hypothetical protein